MDGQDEHAPVQESTEIQDLVKITDTESPEPPSVQALQKRLDQSPAIWQTAGDLSRLAKRMALTNLPPVIKESALRQMEAMEAELGYADAPRIERLLIEQITSCWLQVHLAEIVYGPTALSAPGLDTATVLEKRLSGAHRRYMKSIETLARVRRMLRPEVLQVNIGAQQVNVAGGGSES